MHESGRQAGSQGPRGASVSEGRGAASAAVSAAPLLLNAKQAARWLGVSERTFATLRHAGWLPPAIELGPRALRWHRDELSAAALAQAPRAAVKAEPAQLATARERRAAK